MITIIELDIGVRVESTFIWTIGCESMVSLHSLSFLFSTALFDREDVEREPVDEQATYVGYNDYDSDLRYVRSFVPSDISKNKQNGRMIPFLLLCIGWYLHMGVFSFILCTVPKRGGDTVV